MASPPDVVLVVFNRPDLVERTLTAVLAADVGRVWVVGDGPRPERAGETERVEATRAVVRGFAARDRRVVEDHADDNLGLRRNFERAIDRLMGEHARGVVLEDDTLPEPSFFAYAGALLDQYAADERVGSICGQAMAGAPGSEASYGYSHIPPPWGWATWSRAWQDYQRDLSGWPGLRDSGRLEALVGPAAAREWGALFDNAPTLQSYWIRWVLTHWCTHRLAVVPRVNLISNIGVDERGTHTTSGSRYARFAQAPTEPIRFPLRPPRDFADRNADEEQRVAEGALPFSARRRRLKQAVLEGPLAAYRGWRRG